MARKRQPIIGPSGATPNGDDIPAVLLRAIDRALAIQRPVILAHLRSIRRRHPQASPQQLVTLLEHRYVAAVTTGGAAVGATAVIPGIGTGITLALSTVETAGFLEATALYAQSLSELHGIAVSDPERARALVMTMMLGREGSDLVRQLAGQVSGSGLARTRYWGELVTSSLPSAVLGPLVDRLKSAFIRQFAVRGGAGILARAIPFGVGAVIGGAGNNILARRVLYNSRLAFGAVPDMFAAALEPPTRVVRIRKRALRADAVAGVKRIGSTTAGGVKAAAAAARKALPRRK